MTHSEYTIRSFVITPCLLLLSIPTITYAAVYDPPERMMQVRPTFEEHTERQLRYHPDGTDFVIENGNEFFNRPLYGGNTAFRVDAGDKPEFSLFLPGHGGNLRFGIRTPGGAKWLNNADKIISRYRPGAMLYEIRDEMLEEAVVHLSVIGLYEADGLIVKVDFYGQSKPVELIVAFGGADGKRGRRGGDIGCESQPVGKFFQLEPQNCKGNQFTINSNAFILESKLGTMTGIFPKSSKLAIADAGKWNTISELIASAGGETEYPVLISTMTLSAEQSVYTALKRIGDKTKHFRYENLPALYEKTQQQRQQIAQRISVETPDSYVNAAASALCIAADAIWDEKQGSVMHGAVAWRSRYLGWRGPYANDVFGWHDRAERHLTYWADKQNTNPIPATILPADSTANLARNEPSLHSNGDMAGRHYDMNLVYMDALFRHILWTGDLDLARRLWPVIERHMAWERRLFRRPFSEDNLPLYEAYAAIWASDDLQYHGGGVTYTSAYNYYHNRMVARLAKELGKDPAPYEQEAELIHRAMNKYLWLNHRGWFAEFKDLLGLQATHPSAALWTFYHTIDSEAADPLQAWQMSRFVDTQFAHIPVYGGDIPKGEYFTLPTTSWMPYTWSTNNVVMAEAAHTSLAYWQAQRPDKAFALFKGCILDSMYMGKCPGNAGMTTYFDMARGEAQRDFGDAVGTCSRALVEGLFGIKPDMLAGVLKIAPGFPQRWAFASINHPDVVFTYQRQERKDTYTVKPQFSKPMALQLRIKARSAEIEAVKMNGNSAKWKPAADAVGSPYIEITCELASDYEVQVVWKGPSPAAARSMPIAAQGGPIRATFDGVREKELVDPQEALEQVEKLSDSFTGKATGRLGHRTVFVQLQQGSMTWTAPVQFEIRKSFEFIAAPCQKANELDFQIRNNTSENINEQAVIRLDRQSRETTLRIPAFELSEPITLSLTEFDLLPGSNHIRIEWADGQSFEGTVINWDIDTKNLSEKCEPMDLSGIYNDKVTQIFQNEYLSPRSPYCSLAIPKQGIGSWCNYAKTFDVNDSGLRAVAQKNGGFFILPQGVRFRIPINTKAKNVVFTSQWDNYPNAVTIDIDGKAQHLYLLMAGSTNSMQSQFDNGEVIVTYTDGSTERLALRNPTTWWPIDQDYFIDDFGFKRPGPIPPRIDMKTGNVRILDMPAFKGKGGTVPGGAATVLDVPLNENKELKTLKLQTLANEVIIGLISATIVR